MDLETLTRLLQNFHEELKVCMERTQDAPGIDGVEREISDPILLGDFIVDAYNSYLASAKATCDNSIIQSMPEIQKLGEADHAAGDTEGQGAPHFIRPGHRDVEIPLVGGNPRLQKMREVALAARQLQTALEGVVKTGKSKTQSAIAGVTTLLENLGEHIIAAQDEAKYSMVPHLVGEYNRCLAIVLEDSEDPITAKMFHSLETNAEDEASYEGKLSELRLAQSGLLNYLQKMQERSAL
jgi:hypothetical protein